MAIRLSQPNTIGQALSAEEQVIIAAKSEVGLKPSLNCFEKAKERGQKK